VVFTGTYEHTIDTKNRLAIPADFRNAVQRAVGAGESDPLVFYVTFGDKQTLHLFPQKTFEQQAEAFGQSEQDLADYEQLFYSLAHRVELDRQGRVRLPENLLRRSGLGSEVALLGVRDHIEVHDRQAWLAHVERVLAERPEMIVSPARMTRRRLASGS